MIVVFCFGTFYLPRSRLFAVNLNDLFFNNTKEIRLYIRVYVRNLSDASFLCRTTKVITSTQQ